MLWLTLLREEPGFFRMPSISRHSRAQILYLAFYLAIGIKIHNRHFTWNFYLAFVTGKQHKHTTNNTINTPNEEKMKTADKAAYLIHEKNQ